MNIDFNAAQSVPLTQPLALLDPMESTMAGYAVGRCAHPKKVGVGYTGDNQAKANAMAVIAGLSSAGVTVWDMGECFESQLSFFVPFAGLSAGIFINGMQNTLRLFGEDGLTVSGSVQRRVAELLENSRTEISDYGRVFDMASLDVLYQEELIRSAPYGIAVGCEVVSANEKIQSILRDCMPHRGGDVTFKINRFGTSLSACTEKNGTVPFVKLLAVCGMNELESGRDISVPLDAPSFLDNLAHSYGRRAYRYLTAPSDGSDSEARRLAARQFWSRDALFLAVRLMSILTEQDISFDELYARLPDLYVSSTVLELDIPIDIIEKLNGRGLSAGRDGGNGVVINSHGARAHLSACSGGCVSLVTQGADMEAAQELSADILGILEGLS